MKKRLKRYLPWMPDFEMEGPEASKTQVTRGPFLESPDN